MSFVVDTDMCSAYIKGHPLVTNRFIQFGGNLYLSVVTLGELTVWARRANATPRRAHDIQVLLKVITPLDVTVGVAIRYGEMRAALMDAGRPGPELDLLIAATALDHGYAVVTHNVADYANIPGLSVVDWLTP